MPNSSCLSYIEKRYYKIGKCLAALSIRGELSSHDLALEVGMKPNGLLRMLRTVPEVAFNRKPHKWFYESTGQKTNHAIKRDIVYFSLVKT